MYFPPMPPIVCIAHFMPNINLFGMIFASEDLLENEKYSIQFLEGLSLLLLIFYCLEILSSKRFFRNDLKKCYEWPNKGVTKLFNHYKED